MIGPRAAQLSLVIALIFVSGWGLAFLRAPTAVVDDPCRAGGGSPECQLYVQCPEMAGERRLLAIERVTLFDVAGSRARCEYVTWAGLGIGRVEVIGNESHWLGNGNPDWP